MLVLQLRKRLKQELFPAITDANSCINDIRLKYAVESSWSRRKMAAHDVRLVGIGECAIDDDKNVSFKFVVLDSVLEDVEQNEFVKVPVSFKPEHERVAPHQEHIQLFTFDLRHERR